MKTNTTECSKSYSFKAGSLFSGIGGLDLGFERAGFECSWWIENNPDAAEIMERHWPGVGHGDIRDCYQGDRLSPDVDVIYGGDPCPKHSRARSSHRSSQPDLAGYFLAVVGRLRPKWVVRENVRSSSSRDFDFALSLLGYGTAIIGLDAAGFTGQSRQREFVVGRYQTSREGLAKCLPGTQAGKLPARTSLGTQEVASCLTTHRTRYDSRDNYILEYTDDRYQLRIPDSEERERLAGFPKDWTKGFHPATRARLLGNSVVPAIARWLAVRIAGSLARDACSKEAR